MEAIMLSRSGASERYVIVDAARHWSVRFRKNKIIFNVGEFEGICYKIIKGCVRLQVDDVGGDRQIVAFIFPGELFGCLPGVRSTTAEAVTSVEAEAYSISSIIELNEKKRGVAQPLIDAETELEVSLAQLISNIVHLPASGRLLWFCRCLHFKVKDRDVSGFIEFPMSHRDIGDYLGLNAETVSRGLRDLETGGLITRRGRRAFILGSSPIGDCASTSGPTTTTKRLALVSET
jgi:CRP-like cAMP-binding protein